MYINDVMLFDQYHITWIWCIVW